jgi:predicted transcriptional regulator
VVVRDTRHPLLILAETDRRIRKHHAFLVLARLIEALGEAERPVYVGPLSQRLALDERTMKLALQSLTDAGYLVRGAIVERAGFGFVHAYRLGALHIVRGDVAA